MACRAFVGAGPGLDHDGDRRAAVYAADRFGNGRHGSFVRRDVHVVVVSDICKTCMLCTYI